MDGTSAKTSEFQEAAPVNLRAASQSTPFPKILTPRSTKLKRLILALVIAVCVANAGIVRTASYPVRHPVRLVRKGAHVVFFPVAHPKRSGHQAKRVIW